MKLKRSFTLAHINVRKQKAGKDLGPTAVDLKWQAEVHPQDLKDFFPTEASYESVIKRLFLETGELVCSDFKKIELHTQCLSANLTITNGSGMSDALKYKGATVDKVRIEPKAGPVVGITFRTTLVDPGNIDRLTEWNQQDLDVTISGKWADKDKQQSLPVQPPPEELEEMLPRLQEPVH